MSSGLDLNLESLKKKYLTFSNSLIRNIEDGLSPQYENLAVFLNILIKKYLSKFPKNATNIIDENLHWWDGFITSLQSNLSTLITDINKECFTTRNMETIKTCLSNKVQQYVSSCAKIDSTTPADFYSQHVNLDGSIKTANIIGQTLKNFQNKIKLSAVPLYKMVLSTSTSTKSVQQHSPTPLGQVAFTALLLLLFL